MAISTAALPDIIGDTRAGLAIVQSTGLPTLYGQQVFQQSREFVNGMNRIIPCNCSNVGNVYTLTMLSASPKVTHYAAYETFAFVASATSGGAVTVNVVTPQGALATIPAYKNNGAVQAALNDITINLQYFATYVDSLNAGAGGFVLR